MAAIADSGDAIPAEVKRRRRPWVLLWRLRARSRIAYDARVRVVVNHLRFKEPIPTAVIDAAKDVTQQLVDASGLAASLVEVDRNGRDPRPVVADVEAEDRIKSEIGGPWMREHIIPLLGGSTERHSGEVDAGAT